MSNETKSTTDSSTEVPNSSTGKTTEIPVTEEEKKNSHVPEDEL